jgi:hypothetical protein
MTSLPPLSDFVSQADDMRRPTPWCPSPPKRKYLIKAGDRDTFATSGSLIRVMALAKHSDELYEEHGEA